MAAVDFSIDVALRVGVDWFSIDEETRREIERDIEVINDELGSTIESTWPVDTGRSLSMWENFFEDGVWVIRNPVEYASFVHRPEDEEGSSSQFIEAEAERLFSLVSSRLLSLASSATGAQASMPLRQRPTLDPFRGMVAAFAAISSSQRNRDLRERSRSRIR